jgi:hypothetical protein
MRLLRGLAGALLWILAALIGLVGVLLCLTVLLLPLGIPLLGAARRMFSQSVRLMLPPSVAHPVKAARHSVLRGRDRAASAPAAAAGAMKKRRRSRWAFWKRG